jgi:hypothetical protein
MRKKLILGLVTVTATIIAAHADIIPTLNPTAPAAVAGGFTWNYATNVTVDETVNTGDFFTIYDFGSIVPNSNLQPSGWTFSSALTTAGPAGVNPTDDPSKLNLTWTYTGNTALVGASSLGNFSVIATTDQAGTGNFVAQATRSAGTANAGTKIDNIGTVSVPVPEMSALLPILSVCGAGFAASVPSLLRRRKQS